MLLLMSFMLQIWMKLMVLMLLMMSNLTIMTMMMILMMIRPGEGGTFCWLASQPASRPAGRPPRTGHTPWALVRAWPGILWGLARRYMDQIEALSEIYKIRWVPAARYSIKWSIMTKQCRTYEKIIKINDENQSCRAFFSGHFCSGMKVTAAF